MSWTYHTHRLSGKLFPGLFSSMRVFELEPGAAPPMHVHWYEQEMYMLEGRGVLVGDHGKTPLEPG